MKFCIAIVLALGSAAPSFAQDSFTAFVRDAETKEPLSGASVIIVGTSLGASADEEGFVRIAQIPAGTHTVAFSIVGYERLEREFRFPRSSSEPLEIFLHREEEELEEVVVVTTRTSRSIADEPTRLEAITLEELNEKSNMKPGDIRMLLNESTGIQTQQTSATTANASIRIQGLDGRFTQILKDGFPLYAGFAGGLSLLQIPPLDLQQVEIIKGSVSTLYGSGAIAGIVNLISKSPSTTPELSFHVNGTSAGGLDLHGFYAARAEKFGLTVFAARNSNAPYDPAGIDLTAIPQFDRYTFNPRVFWYIDERSTITLGMSAGFENRLGGDIHFIRGEGDSLHSYFERNKSARISTQFALSHSLSEHSALVMRNSLNFFNRALEIPRSTFDGRQFASFSEVSYAFGTEKFLNWIIGANLWTDVFTEQPQPNRTLRNSSETIVGAFLQHTGEPNDFLTLETGLRVDYATNYGAFVLPRISALFRFLPNLTSRVGGGLGYKLPTIFNEEAEALQFQNILPLDAATTDAERSIGGNLDVNYRATLFDAIAFSLNQLVYYTKLDKPLVLSAVGTNLKFVNANGHIDTKGIETNMKLSYRDLKLFVGYTLTDAQRHFNGTLSDVPLTPKHRLNTVLIYEVHDAWRVGLEAYYFSPQRLNDGALGKPYWVCGFMAEKIWENLSLYINFENFLDARQTRFDTIHTGSVTRPLFRDIYAPVDGFVVNGGVKVKL